MGTFHALCARVLRRDGAAIGIDPRFTIYDTDDQTGLIKQVLRDLELPGTGELRPAAVLGAISRWKNDLVSPLEADELAQGYLETSFAKAYARYAERLRKAARPRLRRPAHRGRAPLRAGARRARPLPASAGATSTSTSTRTPTAPSTCG